MKIISKFKDFYDYKVAKYGMDEKLVYTRKTYCEYFERFVIDVYTASGDRISEENFNKNLKDDINPIDEKNIHKILLPFPTLKLHQFDDLKMNRLSVRYCHILFHL